MSCPSAAAGSTKGGNEDGLDADFWSAVEILPGACAREDLRWWIARTDSCRLDRCIRAYVGAVLRQMRSKCAEMYFHPRIGARDDYFGANPDDLGVDC